MILVLLWALGVVGQPATVGGDVLFELAKPARAAALAGVDLALPSWATNPGALGFRGGWEIVSGYASPFFAGHFGHVALAGPGLALEAFLFYSGEIAPGLSFRAEGGAASLGLSLGALGLGVRARLLHFGQPQEALGAALELGFLWRGSLWLGGVVKNVWSQSPFPGEPWPLDLSCALVLPLRLWGFTLYAGAAAQDLLTLPRYAGALALEAGGLALVASAGTTGLALGGSLAWASFRLEWAFLGHPSLPLGFRVSLALQWP